MACPFCNESLTPKLNPTGGSQLYACGKCYNPLLISWDGSSPQAKPLDRTPDVRLIAPEGSIGAALLEALPQATERLPVLPEISQRVLRMVSDPDISMSDLAAVIRED